MAPEELGPGQRYALLVTKYIVALRRPKPGIAIET